MAHFFDFIKRSLYNIASFILFLSYGFFFLLKNLSSVNFSINAFIQMSPIILGSVISFLCLSFYHFWRRKEYFLVRIHMKKNYLKFDLVAVSISFFLIPILYIISIPFIQFDNLKNENIILISILVGYGILILFAQVFHQYFLYKVKTDLARRRKGIAKKLDAVSKLEKKDSSCKKISAGEFYEK